MEAARRLHLVEVKCAMTLNPSLERGIGRVAAVTSALSKTIVYRGEGFPALFPRIAGKTQTRRCRFS